MAKPVLEGDLRSILRDDQRFPSGTVSFCEFGLGGDPGLPDCWVAGTRGYWIPLELKRGPSVVKALRPAQRLWHRTSLRLGIDTYGATILSSGGMVRFYQITLEGRTLSEKLMREIRSTSMEIRTIQCILQAQ